MMGAHEASTILSLVLVISGLGIKYGMEGPWPPAIAKAGPSL